MVIGARSGLTTRAGSRSWAIRPVLLVWLRPYSPSSSIGFSIPRGLYKACAEMVGVVPNVVLHNPDEPLPRLLRSKAISESPL